MTFVSQVAVLAPMIALDLGYRSQKDKDSPRTRNLAAIAALMALVLISTPILPFFLDYFTLNFSLYFGILIVGIPAALWFTWAGSLIGNGMYITPRLVKKGIEIISPRVAWLSFIILFACTVFVLVFIMTSSPPV
jgi:hypothetical protein